MPAMIRTTTERLRSRPKWGGFVAVLVFATLCSALGVSPQADANLIVRLTGAVATASHGQVAVITTTLGLLCFVVLAIIVLLRMRKTATLVRPGCPDWHDPIPAFSVT